MYLIFDLDISVPPISDFGEIDISLVMHEVIQKAQEARSLRRREIANSSATLIFRLPVEIDWSFYNKEFSLIRDVLASRAAGSNPNSFQYLLWSENFEHRLYCVNRPTENEIFEVTIQGIKFQELSSLVERKGVFFEHSKSALFRLPSGHISDFFFRVGNLQVSEDFARAVFFWSLPELKKVMHVICDTWSISTTAARISSFIFDYRANHEGPLAQQIVRWSYSSEYFPENIDKQYLIEKALHTIEKKRIDGELLFLSSYYSSGRLEDEISSCYENASSEIPFKMIAIYADDSFLEEKRKSTVLCSLSPFFKDKSLEGKSVPYRSDLELLDVDGRVFFPDYRTIEFRKFVVPDTKDKGFFETYKGLEAFSVHRDGKNSPHHGVIGRHHAFHVDVEKVFKSLAFRKKVNAALSEAIPCTHVISDGSEGAQALLEAITGFVDNPIKDAEIHHFPDWRKISENENLIQALNDSSNRLMVLIPTVVSGNTIGDIKKFVRQVCPDNLENLHFVIGLLRPDSKSKITDYYDYEREKTKESYVAPSALSLIEKVLLPNWGKKRCPWCLEDERLANILDSGKLSGEEKKLFSRRLNELRHGSINGLSGAEIYFTRSVGEPLPFNKGSLFLEKEIAISNSSTEESGVGFETVDHLISLAGNDEASCGDLCLAVANSMQNWRERAKLGSTKRLAIDAATISDDDRFNEAQLRAALWRCLKPSEARLAAMHGRSFENMRDRIFSNSEEPHHDCLELEVMLAFGEIIKVSFSGDYSKFEWNSAKYLCS